MVYLAVSTAIAAACVVLAMAVVKAVREERLAQRGRSLTVFGPVSAEAGKPERAKDDGKPVRNTPLARRLRAAGIGMSPTAFVTTLVALAFLAYACGLTMGGTAVGVVAAAGVLVGGRVWVRRAERKRRELFDVQLAHALPQIAASVRGSLTLERALRVASVHMEEPLRSEVARVLADASYGMPLADALERMAERTQSQDVKTLAAATRIRQSRGGSIAAALALISKRVDARLREARELKVEIAGTRAAKWFVACAMPALFALMYVTNADFARFYQSEPLGWVVLGVAVVLEVAGLLMSRAITSVERV
ncbi:MULTISPECIES: type II secretion system F family protein [Gordonibacter]|uniref:Type II secretion system F family protein n=1 Tax=Gordonibacter faecis TaxID=3047475 RepID=A0ABT7DP06_9ACTN|nr:MULTISPECIES: type II secretion system F family protein [unclassified Gordonibacter]MDJ1650283.1 type II secretion system F family protein [Gordonibacter sp. KGMB12511]HIW76871.1 type II secretion system F family protein [Candidatus Gordonibacter avicola]